MTSDERLALVRVKIERAKRHIRDLEVVRQRFFDSEPYRIESKFNPQTGQTVYNVTDLKPPPVELGLIAGDVIHNLRTAFDHLVWQLVEIGCAESGITLTKRERQQIGFPFWETASEYQAQRHRRVKGMRQSAIDAIDVTYPYKGGNDLLWSIHYLDIADKHHALLVTFVSLKTVSFQIPSSIFLGRYRQSIGGFSVPSGVGTPLQDGNVILIREPDMHYEPQFAIDVALTEPGIVKGHPLVEILQHLSDLVDGLILSFRDELT